MYQYTLNGIIIEDQPANWDKFQSSVSYDKEYKLWSIKRTNELVFFGYGYEILKNAYDSGYCSDVTLNIIRTDTDLTVFDGYIKVSDIKWDLLKKTATVTPIDKVFERFINNNKSIEFGLGNNLSKTGETITPPAEINIHFQVYAEGGAFPGDLVSQYVDCFDFKEVMEYVVAFMSDANLTFESDWYDGLSTSEKILVANGNRLRGGSTFPILEFRKLVTTILRLYNLYLIVDEENSVVRIEDEGYFGGGVTTGFDDIAQMTFEIDQDQLYSGVSVGCNKASSTQGLPGRYPQYSFLTFREEKYFFETQCNIDNLLDLTYEYITDHNIIQDIIINGASGNDQDIFIVEYDSVALTPNYGDPGNTGNNYVINTKYLNSNYIQNYELYNDLTLTIAANTDLFFAETNGGTWDSKDYNSMHSSTSAYTINIKPDNASTDFRLQFDDYSVGNDVNNNFGNYDTLLLTPDVTAQGTQVPKENSVYIVPADGLYTFTLFMSGSVQRYENGEWSSVVGVAGTDNYVGGSTSLGNESVWIEGPDFFVYYNPSYLAFYMNLKIKRYDNAFSLLATESLQLDSVYWLKNASNRIYEPGNGYFSWAQLQQSFTKTINCSTGDIITYEIEFVKNLGFKRDLKLYVVDFLCSQSASVGGTISSTPNADPRIGIVKFNKDITVDGQNTLLTTPYSTMTISDGTYSGTGLIKSCQIDHTKGMGEFELWVKKSFFED